jgi:hypothetical protein
LFPSLKMNRIRERKRREREREKKDVPIPITVPYSDFLSSAETAGGQRAMRATKRKKAKEREERRREECFLEGRAMFNGRESEKSGKVDAPPPLYISEGPRRPNCHVIHSKEPRVIIKLHRTRSTTTTITRPRKK